MRDEKKETLSVYFNYVNPICDRGIQEAEMNGLAWAYDRSAT